jgi:hypothetical protein
LQISITGHSESNELILLDSFTYAPIDNYIISNILEPIDIIKRGDFFKSTYVITEAAVSKESEDLNSEFILVGFDDNSEDFDIEYDSTDNTNSDTTTTEIVPPVGDDEEGFWTPLTISLVSAGSVVGLGMVIGGAYYLGSLKTPTIEPGFEEPPPPPRIIPRVRDVYGYNSVA